jgi:hypothetical protein
MGELHEQAPGKEPEAYPGKKFTALDGTTDVPASISGMWG